MTSEQPVQRPATTADVNTARIALIRAGWHKGIVDRAGNAFISRLAEHGYQTDRIDCFDVPGAFEIPLFARRLARAGRHAAIAGVALVVDGGIYRHDFVAHAVIDGLMHVQLATDVPIFSMVLTPHHFHEHAEHQRFFTDHFVTKGQEVAEACVRMLDALRNIERGVDQNSIANP